MAIKILRADEPLEVKQLVVVIYAAPGIGKSTLSFSADKPLGLDFDRGSYRAANRGDTVQINSWPDVTGITADDLKHYNTVVVDTAGRALDFLTADILRRDPKKGYGGALNLQGYGMLKAEFTSWLNQLKLIGKDVVLVAHSSEEKKGDEIIERLDVQGGSKGEIYKSADAMGRLSIVNGKRILNFSPTDTAFGKNPGCLAPITVPDIASEPNFLSGVIQTIKDKLNSLTDEQKQRQAAIEDWMARVKEAETVEQYNGLVGLMANVEKSIAPVIKGYLHGAAVSAGLEFDKKSKCYVEKAAA